MIVLKSSKGQIQMMETIMVVMVFMIVLIVALAFFFKFQLASLEEKGDRACIVSNTVLLSAVSSMPEIQCSKDSKTERCVDTSKLVVFNPEKQYGSLFTTNCNQKIYFTQLYPEPMNDSCTLNTYPNCGRYDFFTPNVKYSSSIRISTPTTLYFPLTDEYKLGRLTIEVLQ